MPEQENTASLGQKSGGELENGSSPVDSSIETDGSRPAAEDRSVPKSGWKRIWYSVKVFLDSLGAIMVYRPMEELHFLVTVPFMVWLR